MNDPLISVIISVFNEEKYIAEALRSILNQSYINIEIIVVDDYSTDNSVNIIKSFNDSRIRLFQKINEKRYLSSSRNIGIRLARGEYIILQDADDLSSFDRIEKQFAEIKVMGKDSIVGCLVNKINEDGSIQKINLPIYHDEIIKGFSRKKNRVTIVAGTIMASKSIFENFNYNENLKYGQDWDHLLRLNESGKVKFFNVPEYLYDYYQRPKNSNNKKDWIDYNILIRINQELRKTNTSELQDLYEMETFLKKNIWRCVYWNIFRYGIKFNLLRQKYFNKLKKI